MQKMNRRRSHGLRMCVALAMGAWLALTTAAQGQGAPGYAPASPTLPIPLGSTRPEDGGPYTFANFVMYRQDSPLRSQPIAVRGFTTSDTSLGFPVGTFIGSGAPALNVNNVNGQVGYQPGYEIGIGWKLKDGSAISMSWLHLTSTEYRNGATLYPDRGNLGQNFEETFLSSFVYGFPPEYAGPDFAVGDAGSGASAQAATGIWNAASIMTIVFEQRFNQFDFTYRYPLIDEEDYRVQALVGPRYAWIWERFKWRTTKYGDPNGDGTLVATGQDVGIYTNITSNRMYGVHAGTQTECYLGHGFAAMLEVQGALFLNSTKQRAKYETGQPFAGLPENKRSKREFSIVPEVSAMLNLQWYPTEFVQVTAGYELMYFFNTFASTRPIDYNYSNVGPTWDHVNRLFDGFRVGVALWF